jgi:exosortase N
MTGLISIPLKEKNWLQPVNLIALGYMAVAIVAFQNYLLIGSVNFMLGLLALPFAWKVDHTKKCNYRYGWLTLALLLLCFLMPVKTLLYFSIGFALLFFTECFYGKTSLLAWLVIVFASPVFQYLGDVFSFPLRLQLTKLAGSIINLFGSAVEVKGNMIILGGNEFAVDPACMGLNMITASLLAGTMLLGFYQIKHKRRLHVMVILVYLLIILLLNVLANLFRIILLVQFKIQPGTISHDMAGLGCLLLYVLIPAVGLANFLVKQAPIIKAGKELPSAFSKRHILMHLLLLAAILLLSFRVLNTDTFTRFKIPTQGQVAGYSVTSPAQGIVKLDKAGVLIYVKYIRGFYDTEHNPMICWTGGGYEFKNVEIEKIGDKNVFTGTISNGRDKFYSAWWYDNGKKNTISQFEWRWDLVRGADHYVLVNVSCSTKKELIKEVQKIDQEKNLDPFFLNK